MNDTLPDDLWKDSFDKLLEPQSQLRAQNLLKRNVRASFNLDSSVENSLLTAPTLKTPCAKAKNHKLNVLSSKIISTPIEKRHKAKPFQCSISPISSWKLLYFDKSLNKEKQAPRTFFEATKLNPTVVVDDYENENVGPSNELTLEPINLIEKQKNKRHVCFQTISEKPQSPRQSKHTCFLNVASTDNDNFPLNHRNKNSATNFALQPGKWRKSLSVWKRKNRPISSGSVRISTAKQNCFNNADHSVEFVGVLAVGGRRKSIFIKPERQSKELIGPFNEECEIDFKQKLLHHCNQDEPLPFNSLYGLNKMVTCKKLGEGVFGEVFLKSSGKSSRKRDTVLKIIPIEGSKQVNGEDQKTFEQILPEIIISKELCGLRKPNIKNVLTSGFIGVERVTCVQGVYPNNLIKLWEEYDDNNNSENDNPKMFDSSQLYVVLELAFGGRDLSSFLFNSAEQSYYAFQQIILTLAAGEESFQFEHRDLHWGNVLLIRTTAKNISYKIQGKSITIPTKYIKVTIIDYTLSRITYNGCCLFNDLSCDEELFKATGDYQFDIYRMMREILCNKWDTYQPRTNVFWLSYIISKIIDGVNYKNVNTKTHSCYMEKLQHLQNTILGFESALQCAKHLFKI